MADRFPGGVISKTPPTVVAPVDGEGGSASGVWTLAEQLGLQKAGSWPKPVLPRELYAWGNNYNGGLGDGTTVAKSSPVQIGALTNWAQISASSMNATAAVTTNGELYAWGNNGSGQLGDGTTLKKSSPVQIGALTNWAQVAIQRDHTAAIKTDGTIWGWGNNGNGQIGDGTTANKSSPVQIGALTDWEQVASGREHTVAVTTGGELYAWGNNGAGRLGDGTQADKSSPVQIGALTNWAQVSAGDNFCVSVKTDKTLWSWGGNNQGQLGLNLPNSYNNRSSPVQVGALTNWAQAAAGPSHVVAITTGGELYAWGGNSAGQLGDGTVVYRSSPVQIGALTTWSQVSTGSLTAAVKTDGTLWAWGLNSFGQLGDGTVTNKSSPVQIGADTNWNVTAAANHVIATTKG